MPLLRYKTGDVAILAEDETECPCGRHFPLVAGIEGRMDDWVKTPEGRSIPMVGCNMFKHARNFIEAQIVQDRLDAIRILVVPLPLFADKDEEHLVELARERLGPAMRVMVERVQEIPRTRTGKLRAVVCNV